MTNPVNTPDPIGPVHFSQARAVLVRGKDEPNGHSAVHGDLNVFTETVNQTNAILEHWSEIMQVAADKATEILNGVK